MASETTSAKAWVGAIWGAVTGVIGSLTVVLVGDATLQGLTQGQWLAVIGAGVAGFGGGFGLIWSTTNAQASSRVSTSVEATESEQAAFEAIQSAHPSEEPPTPGV